MEAVGYVVDSHVLLWFLEGSTKLPALAVEVLAAPDARLIVPSIAVAEIGLLIRKGRTSVTWLELQEIFHSDKLLLVDPIDLDIVIRACQIEGLDGLHDQLIVACVQRRLEQGENVLLLTSDHVIREAGLVPTLW